MNKQSKKIFFIGIAGPSGAGKTTVGMALKKDFPELFEHIRLDDYLKSPSRFPKKGNFTNWEDPRNLNFSKLIKHISILKHGNMVRSYFNLYVPEKKSYPLIIKPKKFMVVEGFLLFTDKKVRGTFDLKIYLNIPIKVTLRRRALRMGKMEDEISEYDRKVVIPEFKKHGLPQLQSADVVIDGNRNIAEVEKDLIKVIEKKFYVKL